MFDSKSYRGRNFHDRAYIGQYARKIGDRLGTGLSGSELTSRLNELLPKIGIRPDHNGQYKRLHIEQLLSNYYGKMDQLRELWSMYANEGQRITGGRGESVSYVPRRKGESNVSNELLRNQEVYNEGTVRISESDIREMVSECVSRILIRENVTDIVYHFTDLFGFEGIVGSDRLKPSAGEDSVSFTRQRSSLAGFQTSFREFDGMVRFTVDGRKLNQTCKGGPFNWNADERIQSYKSRLNVSDFVDPMGDSDDPNFNEQAEDRVYCGGRGIGNFHRYVIRTDVLVGLGIEDEHEMERTLRHVRKLSEKHPEFNITVYTDEMEFNRIRR